MVNNHYTKAAFSIEPITLCAAFPFMFGNVLKYLLRAPYKGDRRGDLEKALTYLEWHMNSQEDQTTVYDLCQTDLIRNLMMATRNSNICRLARDPSILGCRCVIARIQNEIDDIDAESREQTKNDTDAN